MKRIQLKHIRDLKQIVAGDKCFLREIFHPQRDESPEGYSLAYAYVEGGGRTVRHYLNQVENYYILEGTGKMHIDDEEFHVEKGHSFLVPARSVQWIENTGKDRLEFLVIVSPPWTREDEFVLE